MIPDALGGKLTCKFLCHKCNSTLGLALESKAKSDPSILLAVKNLELTIPSLASEILEGHTHISHSEAGQAQGYINNGEFKVSSKKLDDGSLIQPTNVARDSVLKILKRSGHDEEPILRAMQTFDNAPENKRVELVPGLEVVKWNIEKLELDLSSAHLMNPLIPAKTAYEFLACHLGSSIYEEVKQLSEIRESLLSCELNPDVIQVERLCSNKCEPFHGVCFEGNNPHAKVQVRLFGWLAFRVHFLRLSVGGPRFIYTHKLDTNIEYVQVIDEPAMA